MLLFLCIFFLKKTLHYRIKNQSFYFILTSRVFCTIILLFYLIVFLFTFFNDIQFFSIVLKNLLNKYTFLIIIFCFIFLTEQYKHNFFKFKHFRKIFLYFIIKFKLYNILYQTDSIILLRIPNLMVLIAHLLHLHHLHTFISLLFG